MTDFVELGWNILEKDYVPDAIVRAGIRQICAERLREQARGGPAAQREREAAFLAARRDGPIAKHTGEANQQHYEVPPELFRLVLGPRMKYSGAYWPPGTLTLPAAEAEMLDLTCRRAEIADGQKILDLGCGWGSFSFWVCERYPKAQVVALSNSRAQREHILAERDKRGFTDRLEVIHADVNDFEPPGPFDRIVSIEMFEHTWNHEALLARLAGALAPGGKVFIHVFSHARFCYPFEDKGRSDWIARNFFTGGWMPSDAALLYAQRDLLCDAHWRIDGTHYARTAEAWLANLDARRPGVDSVLARAHGADHVARRRLHWRLFFMACAELFGYHDGREWLVSHYLFSRR